MMEAASHLACANADMATRESTARPVNGVEDFNAQWKALFTPQRFHELFFRFAFIYRHAAGGDSVGTQCLRARGDARGGGESDGAGASGKNRQGVVLAKHSLQQDEDGVGSGREDAEDGEAASNALLLRWICAELHGKSLHLHSGYGR